MKEIMSVALFSFLGGYLILLSMTIISNCNLAFVSFDNTLIMPSLFVRIFIASLLVAFTLLGAFNQISVKGFHPDYLNTTATI